MNVGAMVELKQDAHGELAVERGVIIIGDDSGPHITIAVGGHITDKERATDGWRYTAVLDDSEARIEDSDQVRWWPSGKEGTYESYSLKDLPRFLWRLTGAEARARDQLGQREDEGL
jgi:hypothetical protein